MSCKGGKCLTHSDTLLKCGWRKTSPCVSKHGAGKKGGRQTTALSLTVTTFEVFDVFLVNSSQIWNSIKVIWGDLHSAWKWKTSAKFLNAEDKKKRRICPWSNAAQAPSVPRCVGGTESAKGGGDQNTIGNKALAEKLQETQNSPQTKQSESAKWNSHYDESFGRKAMLWFHREQKKSADISRKDAWGQEYIQN